MATWGGRKCQSFETVSRGFIIRGDYEGLGVLRCVAREFVGTLWVFSYKTIIMEFDNRIASSKLLHHFAQM